VGQFVNAPSNRLEGDRPSFRGPMHAEGGRNSGRLKEDVLRDVKEKEEVT